ncbi:APC family permease [Streptomyces sp. NBC_00144]|uniref:APC family permease n=1 Tax=Streptomyces sp. NBC_00144 TaxID=2975665 RepID=UPI00325107F4
MSELSTAEHSASAAGLQENSLHRGLGTTSIVFMVIAAAAPLAVVAATIPVVISASTSVAIPLYFVLGAAILLLFTVGFTTMSRYVANAGAFYSYVQAGLGRIPGLGGATLAIFSYAGLMLATTSYIGVAIDNVVARYTGVELAWWIYSGLVLIVVGWLGYHDIELSSKVLGVALVLEIGVVVALSAAIFERGGAEGISAASLSPAHFVEGNSGLGLMFAFFAFFAFEATTVFRNEAKDPNRTVPRATYVAVVFIGLFYAIAAFAVINGLGGAAVATASENPENAVLGLASTYVGPFFFDLVQVLVATSLFACILSFHNVITRYVYTLSGRGVMPQRLAGVNARHGAPSAASLAVSLTAGVAMAIVVLSGLDPVAEAYTWLSGAATWAWSVS